jgi:hypothetical protein
MQVVASESATRACLKSATVSGANVRASRVPTSRSATSPWTLWAEPLKSCELDWTMGWQKGCENCVRDRHFSDLFGALELLDAVNQEVCGQWKSAELLDQIFDLLVDPLTNNT